MKKTLSLILALVMIVSLASVLTGCGVSDKQKFVGTWEAAIDLTEEINKSMQEDEEVGEYLKISDFTLTFIFNFREDGTYEMRITEESFRDAVLNIRDDMASGLEKYIAALIGEQGIDVTMDEFYELAGITLDDLIDEVMDSMISSDMLAEWSFSGRYDVKNGRLYTTEGLDTPIDENSFDVYEFDGEDIKLTMNSLGDDDSSVTYHVVLKKVK